VPGLKNAILAAATSSINGSTWLSATGKATMISEVKSHLDDIVNRTFPAGPDMPYRGSPMWGAGSSMGWMHGM